MLSPAERSHLIEQIRQFPATLEKAVSQLDAKTLTTPFIEGEWSVAQNVHHTADSHMNSYIRLKLMLTEDQPPLKPYDEQQWANFVDATPADFSLTFQLLHGLHGRWTAVFDSLTEEQWQRTGTHPDLGEITVEYLLQSYAEHCRAHLEQIQRTAAAAS